MNISEYNFVNVADCQDIDMAVQLLENVVSYYYNMCCPVKKKTVSSRNLKKPWICGNILELVKKRQNMYLLFRQSKVCLLYTSPSPRDKRQSRMPSSA